MAITTAIASDAKLDILQAYLSGKTFKMALYDDATATLGASTAGYTATGEVASGGGYTTTGNTLTGATAALDGTTAYIDFADTQWTSATFDTDGFMIYDDTTAGDPAFLIEKFPSTFSPVSGTFTVSFPAAAGGTAVFAIT